MSNWSEGYLVDVGYTYGYYSELNPLRARLALLKSGFAVPPVGAACELGFGQGLSVNMHAAAGEARWHATDFNPSQAAFAQDLGAVTGASLFDQSFAEFCARDDLPEFDFIGLHGIWSWISDENRAVIVDFLRRKLKVGGLCYISYNTLPGWAAVGPLRHLMTQHADTMSAPGAGVVPRIDAALDFADRLMATNPAYARTAPVAAERLKSLRKSDRNYLAGEYFNDNWVPMYFSDVAAQLSGAKLSYACSATYREHVEALNLSDDQQTILGEIADPVFRETVRDYMVNQQFRRDYWVRGPRTMTVTQQLQALRAERIVLTSRREDVKLEASGARGSASLNHDVYDPVLDVLADNKPHSLGDIEQAVKAAGKTFNQVLQAAIVLIGKGDVSPAVSDEAAAAARPRTDALNAELLSMARSGRQMSYLVSPLTGGGVVVGHIPQLMLAARAEGYQSLETRIEAAYGNFTRNGRRITRNGAVVSDPVEARAEFVAEATRGEELAFPILRNLGIA
ncbi:class I SAM-dependent methyltransferase [Iodidimonas sp. SYSU 1G8]|uniref:class I SAM-dependent methyltransferase n=1 Tax=Iodidimonas sp. SYSU 1G8 TaxID=3133967 RepID=UPI0031FEAE07